MRRALMAMTIVAVNALVGVGASPRAQAAGSGVTPLDQKIPNYLLDPTSHQGAIGTVLFSDVQNKKIFEFNTGTACPNAVALDYDTYRPLSQTGCAPNTFASFGYRVAGNSKLPILAIDPTDRVIVEADVGVVQVWSEDTYTKVASFAYPPGPTASPALSAPVGISWYGPSDEILVTMASSSYNAVGPGVDALASAPPGVAVSSFNVSAALRSKLWAPLWTAQVTAPQCLHAVNPWFSSAAAYRSYLEPALSVPCVIEESRSDATTLPGEKDGFVKVELGPPPAVRGPNCSPDAALCPTGTMSVAPSPGLFTDVVADPTSGRAIMPMSFGDTIDAVVYDGSRNEFIGRSNVGHDSQTGFGLDSATGRLYAFAKDGLTLLDGRRTPVAPGTTYANIVSQSSYTPLAALSADAAHPYARIPIPVQTVGADGGTLWPYFQVYADQQPVSSDPNPASVDQNTGPAPPGVEISTSYSGGARGFGVHDDFVGGPANVVNDAVLGDQGLLPVQAETLPFGPGNRDVLAAEVAKISLGDGSASGVASALDHGDTKTAADYRQTTGSTWPYPQAKCSAPGPVALQEAAYQGTYGGTDDANPTQTSPQPDGDNASVDCRGGTSGPVGQAHYGGNQDPAAAGFPTVAYGPSSNTSTVAPPGSAGVASHSQSVAKGLTILMPGGGEIAFGEVFADAKVWAAGKAGTATATYTRRIGHVVLTLPGGQAQTLCSGICQNDDIVVQQLNAAFPQYIHIALPAPDGRYFRGATADPKDPTTLLASGSPGGYQSVIESDVNQQAGDMKFNGMGNEEATFLPALRVVLYNPEDGNPGLNRHVLDLAGTQVDAELGIRALSLGSDTTGASVVLSAFEAGIPPGAPIPGTSSFVTGTGTGGGGPGATILNGIGHLIARVFHGLGWLLRHPWEGLQLGATMLLLSLPYLLMDRRRIWVREVFSVT